MWPLIAPQADKVNDITSSAFQLGVPTYHVHTALSISSPRFLGIFFFNYYFKVET